MPGSDTCLLLPPNKAIVLMEASGGGQASECTPASGLNNRTRPSTGGFSSFFPVSSQSTKDNISTSLFSALSKVSLKCEGASTSRNDAAKTGYEGIMWAPVVPSLSGSAVPVSRCKQGAVLLGSHVYLLGGRNGNLALKDFWRYHIGDNVWEEIKGGGEPPGCLQEHSMVAYNGCLFVFGGEISFSNAGQTPLWIYNIQENVWRKYKSPKGVVTPKGRRSHTATVFQDSMYVYGGYQDLKGSTSELWAFHFGSETWHLVSQGGAVDGPSPRHRHTAVLHDAAMWIFGGMTDLQERGDFWKFDFVSRVWRPVRSKPGPGCLHSHTAVKFINAIILFGGERDGQTLNELWKFHFATEFWEKLSPVCTKPQPRAQSSALVFSQFRCGGQVLQTGESDTSTLSTSSAFSRLRGEAETVIDARKEGKKYSFLAPDTCSEDEPDLNLGQISQDLYRDLRRSSQFQRLQEDGRTNSSRLAEDGKVNSSVLARVSQMNLTRLSQYCSYSMFNNESTESLAESSQHSARSSTSQLYQGNDLARDVPRMPRDGISVPNFKSLNEEDDSELKNPDCFVPAGDAKVKVGAPRSDSELTFQSYDCSSRASTLPSSRNNNSVRLIDLEETGDEMSSVSGYDSLEAVNMPMPQESQRRSVDQDKEWSNLSFANPHYMGPDLESLVYKNGEDLHTRFADALKSPLDSCSGPDEKWGVELRARQVELRTRPKSQHLPVQSVPSSRPASLHNPSKVVPSRWEGGELVLQMYVMGGREVGQVTVFKRPLSVWRLDLTKL